MKRLLVLIPAAVVLGVLLGGFTLLGHTATTQAAGPFTISMAYFPGEVDSGVVGTTTIQDMGTVGVYPTKGTAMATGISAYYPSMTVDYYTGANCDPNTLVAFLIFDPGAADQAAFLSEGVTLGVTPTYPAILLLTDQSGAYHGGAASINSAGISDLTGYNPANTPKYRNADIQHVACGNADGSTVVSPFGGTLRDGPPQSQIDTVVPLACDYNGDTVCDENDANVSIDMDPTNGTGPCNPVDASRTVSVGDTYQVAICLAGAGAAPNAFTVYLAYDDSLNTCVVADASSTPPCLSDLCVFAPSLFNWGMRVIASRCRPSSSVGRAGS